MNEIWKPVPNHPQYEVSNQGRVRSNHSGEWVIKQPQPNQGKYGTYNRIALWEGGKRKRYYVHRLVAQVFIEGYGTLDSKGKPRNEVNHLNFDTMDNWVENLEWCSKSENVEHWHNNKKQII